MAQRELSYSEARQFLVDEVNGLARLMGVPVRDVGPSVGIPSERLEYFVRGLVDLSEDENKALVDSLIQFESAYAKDVADAAATSNVPEADEQKRRIDSAMRRATATLTGDYRD